MINCTEILRQHHLKATPQRVEIAQTLHTNGHMNIENLYEVLLKKFRTISLATIYKNIHVMTKNGFIQEVKIPAHKSVYELSKGTHSHLVCTQCHSIEDITLDLTYPKESVLKRSSFLVEKTDLILSGLCSKCQKL